ncbi:Gfo/Idh/MocA family protein [Thermotoga neapolitana]|uniref:Gfo/Idh/MocA family protein n=1 Tax=Thermotoga neapolitana TaxID=2337 RepID=UPI0006894CF6|nr:Gfo/Idh/MocA family oxidoreductase [Thermotoga neapolitana]
MVNLCVIGAGRVGKHHTSVITRRIPKGRVVGIYDKDQELTREVASEFGIRAYSSIEEIGEDPTVDAVIITTPTFTHHSIATYFMSKKKHVFCEKPLAITLEEAYDMKRVLENSGVKFQIGFMRRFDSGFREAKEIIENGLLGDIMSIRSITRGPGLPPEWAWDVEKSNGFLAEVNSMILTV